MTEKKNYPEEIYETRDGLTMTLKQRDGHGGRVRRRAYDLGFRDGRFKERLEASNPRAGWSNLTEAIAAGERIDWKQLDGRKAKCVHPRLGALTHEMARSSGASELSPNGWWIVDTHVIGWVSVFELAWRGGSGWSLWVKGELPLRKQTADELAPGTGFCGTHPESGEKLKGMVVVPSPGARKAVIFTRPVPYVAATDVEVIEAYGVGTYYKPEGDA